MRGYTGGQGLKKELVQTERQMTVVEEVTPFLKGGDGLVVHWFSFSALGD
jgi:hypothetical protein